jgi:hypothetical protein
MMSTQPMARPCEIGAGLSYLETMAEIVARSSTGGLIRSG